jgi:hypothetical protein
MATAQGAIVIRTSNSRIQGVIVLAMARGKIPIPAGLFILRLYDAGRAGLILGVVVGGIGLIVLWSGVL